MSKRVRNLSDGMIIPKSLIQFLECIVKHKGKRHRLVKVYTMDNTMRVMKCTAKVFYLYQRTNTFIMDISKEMKSMVSEENSMMKKLSENELKRRLIKSILMNLNSDSGNIYLELKASGKEFLMKEKESIL